jgi:hypothetical protein
MSRRGAPLSRALVLAALLAAGGGPVSAQAEAQRELATAERRAASGDLEGALGDYERIARDWPESSAAIEALARLGWGRWQSGDPPAAAAAARRLVELAPESAQAAGARVLLGEIALAGPSEGASAEAREEFRRAWTLYPRAAFPDLPWRAAGRTREGEVALAEGRLAHAAAAFLDVLEQEPPSLWTCRAGIGLADAFAAQREWLAAADALASAAEQAAVLGEAGAAAGRDARWRLAGIERLRIRPAAGASRWQASRPLAGAGGKRPVAVAAAADGELIVVDAGLGSATVWRDGAVAARVAAQDLERPFWGAGGTAWAPAGGSLERPLGGGRIAPRVAEPARSVRAGAAGRSGVYLLTARPDGVGAYSRELRLERSLDLPARAEAIDLASDPLGRLFLLDAKAGAIWAYEPDGSAPRQVVAGLARPQALAADWLGQLYVLDKTGRIEVFDTQGSRLESLGPALPGGTVLAEPRDLAVDGAGRIFVADAELAAVVVVE